MEYPDIPEPGMDETARVGAKGAAMTAIALSALTPQQQRQRIAEMCGWNPCPLFDCPSWTQHPSGMIGPFVFDLPDYLNDLNAIAGAEQTLTAEQQHHYITHLVEHTHGRRYPDEVSVWKLLNATALQRAQAFLLTIDQP